MTETSLFPAMVARSRRSRPKVLLTEGSSASARQTLYALGHRYDVGVVDADRLCLCRFARLARRFHRCPHYASAPAEYLRFLADTLRSERYDVLLPTHEQVSLLARAGEELRHQVGIALPDFSVLRRMQNKADFVRTLEGLNIPIPPTKIVRSLDELDGFREFPCYVKLPHSTAGMGVRRATNREALRQVVNHFQQSGQLRCVSEILVQQAAQGTMSVVQAVFQEGRMIAAHCAQSLSRSVGGGQGFRVSAWHPNVLEHVRRLGKHLQWHGAIFMEYFYDPTSRQPQYMECNPRIGETVNAMLCGINLCELLVRISLGEKLEAVETSTRVGVRSHVDFLLLVAQAMGGANRRQILKQAWHMVTGTAAYQRSFTEITRSSDDVLSVIPAVATFLQLVVWPRLAGRMVHKSVGSYSLPQCGVDIIERLTEEFLTSCLEGGGIEGFAYSRRRL